MATRPQLWPPPFSTAAVKAALNPAVPEDCATAGWMRLIAPSSPVAGALPEVACVAGARRRGHALSLPHGQREEEDECPCPSPCQWVPRVSLTR